MSLWRTMRTRNKLRLNTEESLPPEARAETLARWAADYFAALGESADRICYEDGGKPVFLRGQHFLSVTHTGALYAAVFAPFPVGLDGERSGEARPRVAARFFSEEEKALPFARVWTAKEAVAKLVGRGLSAVGAVRVSAGEAFYDGKRYALQYETVGEYLLCLARPVEAL